MVGSIEIKPNSTLGYTSYSLPIHVLDWSNHSSILVFDGMVRHPPGEKFLDGGIPRDWTCTTRMFERNIRFGDIQMVFLELVLLGSDHDQRDDIIDYDCRSYYCLLEEFWFGSRSLVTCKSRVS